MACGPISLSSYLVSAQDEQPSYEFVDILDVSLKKVPTLCKFLPYKMFSLDLSAFTTHSIIFAIFSANRNS